MFPNYPYGNVPSGSGGAGYPYMQQPQQPLLPLPQMQPPVVPPMVPPGYSDEYAKWAQWNSHFGAMNPTSSWRTQAATTMRQTPYDRPVTVQQQVPYGGRPYVPRDLSGPNANTMRDSYGTAAVASTSAGPAATVSPWDPAYARPDFTSDVKGPPVPASLNQQKAPEVFYNNVSPNLDFDVNVSSTRLDIIWKPPHVSGKITYEMAIAEGGGVPWTLVFPAEHTRHSMRAKAGESYSIAITAKKVANGITVAHGERKIKAIFSESELRVLYDKAVKYTGTRMHPFQILYRCKPKPYWDDIHHNCGNVMEKYMKDDNGQPANMINGVISGLFFSARLLPNGTLPCSSPFGNVRMLVQAIMLLDPTNVNLYFADFYCNKQAHYVTIIVARKGSESDVYSQKYLIQLDMRNNPWLKYMIRPDGDKWKFLFYAAHSVWVEVLYTESVPLSWGRFDKIAATGLGTSKIGGLSNNKSCTTCNLYPPGAPSAADKEREREEATTSRATSSSTARARRDSPEKRWKDDSFHEDANRSISPGLLPEEDEVEAPESDSLDGAVADDEAALNDEADDLDGVELPAYEMGGNSTFQTMLNERNVVAGSTAPLGSPALPQSTTTADHPQLLQSLTSPSTYLVEEDCWEASMLHEMDRDPPTVPPDTVSPTSMRSKVDDLLNILFSRSSPATNRATVSPAPRTVSSPTVRSKVDELLGCLFSRSGPAPTSTVLSTTVDSSSSIELYHSCLTSPVRQEEEDSDSNPFVDAISTPEKRQRSPEPTVDPDRSMAPSADTVPPATPQRIPTLVSGISATPSSIPLPPSPFTPSSIPLPPIPTVPSTTLPAPAPSLLSMPLVPPPLPAAQRRPPMRPLPSQQQLQQQHLRQLQGGGIVKKARKCKGKGKKRAAKPARNAAAAPAAARAADAATAASSRIPVLQPQPPQRRPPPLFFSPRHDYAQPMAYPFDGYYHHDCPHWTDVIECLCEVVDGVVAAEEKERQRQITSFNAMCDFRVEQAMEEMDSIVGGCDDDKIHDLAGEVHELAVRWQRAREELAKLLEAREAREEQVRAARAMAPPIPQAPPPPTAAGPRNQPKKSNEPEEEEDLDEYLDDDDDVTTTQPPAPAPPPSAAAVAVAVKHIPMPPAPAPTVKPTVPPSPIAVSTPKPSVTPQPQAFKPPAAASPHTSFLTSLAPQTFGSATVTPQATVIQTATVSSSDTPMSSRQKKKNDRKPSQTKIKEEELDEYLDDDEPTAVWNTAAHRTTVAPMKKEEYGSRGTVEVKREIKQEDPLDDSAIELSLLDEATATPAATRKDTVANRFTGVIEIEGEDEFEEEEDTVDLKRSATDNVPCSSKQAPPVAQKRAKRAEIEVIDLTEDELLGSESGSVIDITPEMEEELLRG